MRSPEQMGDAPEEPGQEQVEAPKYDKEKWEKLAQGSAALAIKEGKEIGVPEEELYQFALDVIARETKNRHFGFVYRFMKSMGIGTAKEVKAAGEQAYHSFLESGEAGSSMNIARDVYGSDSEEWERANKLNEAERKKQKKAGENEREGEEQELNVRIPRDATFADLLTAIGKIEREGGLDKLRFEEELWDNFSPDIAREVLALLGAEASEVASIGVLDFFNERGYSQKDVSAFLPIKFKRERNKK
ncbi:MAG: hypothetical protein A3B96_02315 [Candidatus Spechtbacteria bacterium RIFCSPHIGHO2_02_FULL_43_15b]|nr:MAG: hypothetical protein A3B96_02315 [Candidatus Spechtbacteria bacterium RIFCSPHIGHO2_02_FULL_43_15b]